MRAMVWFREDLRVHDNTALSQAANAADSIIAVFLIDLDFWLSHDMAACRIEFILRGLKVLQSQLEAINIPLIIHQVSKPDTAAKILFDLMDKHKVNTLYFNKQYEVDELARDNLVINLLQKNKLSCKSFDDQLILPPNQILTQQESYYKVFTAYKRAWYQTYLERGGIRLAPKIKRLQSNPIASSPLPTNVLSKASHISADEWPAGEVVAIKQLRHFIDNHLSSYTRDRDFPAKSGTSKLSPYLSTGMISPRQCFLTAFDANHHELDTGDAGAITWMSELIWRDFYKQILISVPRVSMNQPFQLDTNKIKWQNNPEHLFAWQQGQTGIPIVDAAMRQLNQTGWMHNRLRMVTAMFFSKNLLLDWRLGEKYFIQHLIDGDLAANNGGWQWSASTGTDAAPYFRVFNPVRQSERFDPNGEFIREYCPELKALSNKAIHDPHTRAKSEASAIAYPSPLVNLEQSRKRAISAFKKHYS